jgi:hypothetical protein
MARDLFFKIQMRVEPAVVEKVSPFNLKHEWDIQKMS